MIILRSFLFFLLLSIYRCDSSRGLNVHFEYVNKEDFTTTEKTNLIIQIRTRYRLKVINNNMKYEAEKVARSGKDPYLFFDVYKQNSFGKKIGLSKLFDKGPKVKIITNKYIKPKEIDIIGFDNFALFDNKSRNKKNTLYKLKKKPKYIILSLVGVGSDRLYYEMYKFTYNPFISNMGIYSLLRKDLGLIFPKPYIRRFFGFILNPLYRFAWADFAYYFRPRTLNINHWKYSVESILKTIDYLVEVENYDPKNIFVYGYSQGSALSLSVMLRTKYRLGGVVSTGGFLADRTSKSILRNLPNITKEGLETPLLLAHCNPDRIYSFRNAIKDAKYLKKIKANLKNFIMLGKWHSCMSKYSMVYVNWIYSIISSYSDNEYKKTDFLFSDLEYDKL